MRHPGQIGHHGLPANVLAERQGQPAAVLLRGFRRKDFAEIHGFALFIRHFDADDVAARDGGDADRGNSERAGDVVGKADHARAADARRRFQFVQGYHRPGMIGDDPSLHTVIGEHGFQPARDDLQHFGARPGNATRRGLGQQGERRKAPTAFHQRQGNLFGGCPGGRCLCRFRGFGRPFVQHRGKTAAWFRGRWFVHVVRHRKSGDHVGGQAGAERWFGSPGSRRLVVRLPLCAVHPRQAGEHAGQAATGTAHQIGGVASAGNRMAGGRIGGASGRGADDPPLAKAQAQGDQRQAQRQHHAQRPQDDGPPGTEPGADNVQRAGGQ